MRAANSVSTATSASDGTLSIIMKQKEGKDDDMADAPSSMSSSTTTETSSSAAAAMATCWYRGGVCLFPHTTSSGGKDASGDGRKTPYFQQSQPFNIIGGQDQQGPWGMGNNGDGGGSPFNLHDSLVLPSNR